MNELLEQEASRICEQYKVTKEEALKQLNEIYTKDIKLQKRISGVENKEIVRFREYKDFIKKAKKEIYYGLRKFHSNETVEKELIEKLNSGESDNTLFNELAQTHISTKERDPYIEDFNKQLLMLAENTKTILDIGGGVFPLKFPFEKFTNLKEYVWMDKDAKAFKMLEPFAKNLSPTKLTLHNEPIGTRAWKDYLPEGESEFDLVLMVKLVSLIYRQERDFIKFLAEVPAKRIFITAPKESLTKKISIYHRENEILKEFIQMSGRRIVNKFDIPNEFGFLVE